MPTSKHPETPGFNLPGTLLVLAIIAIIFAAGGFEDLYHNRGAHPAAANLQAAPGK